MPSPLDDLEIVQTYLACSSDLGSAYRDVARWLKGKAEEGAWDDLADILPRLIVPGLDYTSALSLHRVAHQVASRAGVRDRRVKIAMLGGFTTHQLVTLLDLYLLPGAWSPRSTRPITGSSARSYSIRNPSCTAFRPEFIILATSWRDLGHRPHLGDDRAEVQRKVEAELADWSRLWAAAHDRLGCQIIQNNFDMPPWRTLANHDSRHPGGFSRYAAW